MGGWASGEVTVEERDWIGGQKLVVMRNDHLEAVVAPACGGRLVSLVHLGTGTENLHQVELAELPEVEGPVKEALELMPRLVKPDYPDHWTLGGDVVFDGTPTWDFLAIKADDLWGWLECYVDRGYGGWQGNEHHKAVWDCTVEATDEEVSVEGRYTTKLPPAPLLIRRRYALREGERCVRVSHTITNVGGEKMPVEYYPHVCVTPGGTFDAADRFAVPIKGEEGVVGARLMPTFQEPGGCTKMVPAGPWVAYVDTAKKLLIVHSVGYQPSAGWNWNGRTMCSLESVFTIMLSPGESHSWEGYMGIAEGFGSISNVKGDVAVDIEAADRGEAIEIRVTAASFGTGGDVEGTLTLAGTERSLPRRSMDVALPGQTTGRTATMVVEKRGLTEGRYIARLEAGGEVLAAKVIDIPLVEAFPGTTEKRPILWLAPAYAPTPSYLKALCGFESRLLRSTFLLTPELLDVEKIAALAVTDTNLSALKAGQCAKIIEYVRSGGRFLVLPVGYASLEESVLIPPAQHIGDFYEALGVGPARGSRRNPNHLARRNFRVKAGSVVEHPLTRGLDWTTLESTGVWRYALGKGVKVLARLDTGDPLLVVNNVGKGEVIVYAGPLDIYSLGWGQFGEEMDVFLRRCFEEEI